jgi:prevent-host-death family protein
MARISGHISTMRKTAWSLSEAKDHFSERVEAARGGRPQTVTRHGKAAVIVVRAEDYDRMKDAQTQPRKSFVDFLLGAPKGNLPTERRPAKPRNVTF